MRRAILMAASVVAAVAVATSANAVTTTNLSFTPLQNGAFSTFYGNTPVGGGFTDIYNFELPSTAAVSFTLSSAVVSGATNLSFSKVEFNGVPVEATAGTENTVFEFKDLFVGGGANSFTISGNGSGSYSGTLTYVLANPGGNPAGVPEPASWAMMLGGFGLVGGALRRSRKVAVSFG